MLTIPEIFRKVYSFYGTNEAGEGTILLVLYFSLVVIQVHEASSTKSVRLFSQVNNENTELCCTPESSLLEKYSRLHWTAQLERGRSGGRREKPALQEMSF